MMMDDYMKYEMLVMATRNVQGKLLEISKNLIKLTKCRLLILCITELNITLIKLPICAKP